MVSKIDTREAVRYLDIYSDELISLSLLARVSTLQDKTDEELCEVYDNLKTAIEEKQKEAMLLARDIVASKDRRCVSSDSLADGGVSAAIQRLVSAVDQANEALKPPQEGYADILARFYAAREASEKAAKEAKQAKDTNLVPDSVANDSTASVP